MGDFINQFLRGRGRTAHPPPGIKLRNNYEFKSGNNTKIRQKLKYEVILKLKKKTSAIIHMVIILDGYSEYVTHV